MQILLCAHHGRAMIDECRFLWSNKTETFRANYAIVHKILTNEEGIKGLKMMSVNGEPRMCVIALPTKMLMEYEPERLPENDTRAVLASDGLESPYSMEHGTTVVPLVI